MPNPSLTVSSSAPSRPYLAASSPLIAALCYADLPTKQERERQEWETRVQRMRVFIATTLHEAGRTSATIHDRWHLLALAYTAVLLERGPFKAQALVPVCTEAVARMWSAIEATRTASDNVTSSSLGRAA